MKLPQGHAHIWTSGDTIWLGLPSITSEAGHAIPLPNTPEGLLTLQRILVAREKSTANCRIGNDGSPTRAQIEMVLQKRERDRERRAEREADALLKANPKRPKKQKLETVSGDDLLKSLGMLP
jgi:hypothetical protein